MVSVSSNAQDGFLCPQGVTSPDIRAGMAMVLAALCAKGTSTIHNAQQIERGYEHIERKLQSLGADIRRANDGD